MTLTELAFYVRKFAPIAVLGVIFFLIVFVTFKIVVLLKPEAPVVVAPTPAPAFGPLPPVSIPGAFALPKGVQYTMETVEGVPVSTDSARVYFVPKKTTSLNFRDKATLVARSLAFDLSSTKTQYDEKAQTYTMVDNQKRLVIDIDTFNYSYTQDFNEETRTLLSRRLSDINPDVYKSKATDILKKLTRYPPDLAQSMQAVSYIYYQEASGSAQASAGVVQNPQEANMVAVDFFPQKINELVAVTEDFVGSPNRVVFIPGVDDKDFIVKAQVKVFERSAEQYSIYPLKTGQQALEELNRGEGFLIQTSAANSGKKRVGLTSNYPAYLVSSTYSPYILPVYVFIGEGNFVAYVSALAPQWVQNTNPTRALSPTVSISPTNRILPKASPSEIASSPTPSTTVTVTVPISPTPTPGLTLIPIGQ